MVDFVIIYRAPVDSITNKQSLGLGKYALDEHEWEVLKQLHDVLKVSGLNVWLPCGVTDLVITITY